MDQLPKTVDQAVQAILSRERARNPHEVDYLRSFYQEDRESEYLNYQRWFAMGVRNFLGPLRRNPELLEACGTPNANEALYIILEALRTHLLRTAGGEDLDRARDLRAELFLKLLGEEWLSLARYAALTSNDADRIRAGRRLIDGYFAESLPYHNAEHVVKCLDARDGEGRGLPGRLVNPGDASWPALVDRWNDALGELGGIAAAAPTPPPSLTRWSE